VDSKTDKSKNQAKQDSPVTPSDLVVTDEATEEETLDRSGAAAAVASAVNTFTARDVDGLAKRIKRNMLAEDIAGDSKLARYLFAPTRKSVLGEE
jgi:hypothetical protein